MDLRVIGTKIIPYLKNTGKKNKENTKLSLVVWGHSSLCILKLVLTNKKDIFSQPEGLERKAARLTLRQLRGFE